ncbi:MAG: SPOR domain-containing protein [Alphaproteobacteria bacterium]|nr:MAG: SPOR domain-containing protein [Alphaproteobacteria bacterium]
MAANETNNYQALKWGAAVLSVIISAGLFWYALQERNQRELITVHADATPYKAKPADPGGMQVPHQDKRIFGEAVGRPDKPEENLAKGKEKPVDAAALKTPPPPQAPEPEPAPEVVVEVPKPDKIEVPIIKTQVPKIVAPEPEPEPVKSETAITSWGVQLGAFGTADGAERAWNILRKEHKSVLGGKESRVQSPVTGGNDTLHRLWAGRFVDEDAARAACDTLKKAKQGCMPVWPY